MDVGDCVRDVVLSGREDLVQLEVEINRLIEKIELDYDDVTMQRLADAQERFGALGGYEWHAEGDKILEGLGFPTSSLNRPLREFSGDGACVQCWVNCCYKPQIYCYWMNLRTTWICLPFSG